MIKNETNCKKRYILHQKYAIIYLFEHKQWIICLYYGESMGGKAYGSEGFITTRAL